MAYPTRNGLKFVTSNLKLTPELAGTGAASDALVAENGTLRARIAELEELLVGTTGSINYLDIDVSKLDSQNERIKGIRFDKK
jgi:hypothetical protein